MQVDGHIIITIVGIPCIADPGADLVFLANSRGIDVQTFVGPSSIIMALQLSGLPGTSPLLLISIRTAILI